MLINGMLMNPEYPVYIVSKGRWDRQMTSRELHRLGVKHFIIVEGQELQRYTATINGSATLLVLDPQYQRDYDTCDDLGDSKSKGPGPARNFAWDHSIGAGYASHWVVDDNIQRLYRMNRNHKIPVGDGTIIRCMEEFIDRFENVRMAGPHYEALSLRRVKIGPFTINTRVYSFALIRNNQRFRWRARYNEDTDLSLRILKDGLCTIQFNAFLQNKVATQNVPGGNTAEFYNKEGTLPKSQMLVRMHPDVTKLVRRYGRWHHYVDYSGFKQPLIRKPGIQIPKGVDEHGMEFQVLKDGEWRKAELV